MLPSNHISFQLIHHEAYRSIQCEFTMNRDRSGKPKRHCHGLPMRVLLSTPTYQVRYVISDPSRASFVSGPKRPLLSRPHPCLLPSCTLVARIDAPSLSKPHQQLGSSLDARPSPNPPTKPLNTATCRDLHLTMHTQCHQLRSDRKLDYLYEELPSRPPPQDQARTIR